MIDLGPTLKAVGGAHTGLPPVNLLEVLDVNGNLYLWADRKGNWPSITTAALTGVPAGVSLPYAPTSGQLVFFCPSSRGVGSSIWNNPSSTYTPAPNGGIVSCDQTTLWPVGAQIEWIDFAVPFAHSGVVIDAAHAVCTIASAGSAGARVLVKYSTPGLGEPVGMWDQSAGVNGMATSAPFLPAALEDLANCTITGSVENSLMGGECSATFSQVGFIVYFHVVGSGAEFVAAAGDGSAGIEVGLWQPWLLSVPEITRHRSLQTDVGSFVIQNISGDSLARDAEKLLRASAFEGAEFVYRLWQADAEAAWIEVHGTLKVANVGVDTLTLAGKQTIDPSQADTPLEIYCETCQLQWGGPRCGAVGSTECNYNYQTCQQPNRIMVVMNNYEKNYGETPAVTAQNVINRRRVI